MVHATRYISFVRSGKSKRVAYPPNFRVFGNHLILVEFTSRHFIHFLYFTLDSKYLSLIKNWIRRLNEKRRSKTEARSTAYSYNNTVAVQEQKEKVQENSESESQVEFDEIREFRENRAAGKIQAAWRKFVIRENKISKIMGEEPKFTEFDVLKESLTRNQPNVKQTVRSEMKPEVGSEVRREVSTSEPRRIVNEKTVIVRSSKTFVSGHFEISS